MIQLLSNSKIGFLLQVLMGNNVEDYLKKAHNGGIFKSCHRIPKFLHGTQPTPHPMTLLDRQGRYFQELPWDSETWI
jgi:hypothetical protein